MQDTWPFAINQRFLTTELVAKYLLTDTEETAAGHLHLH